MSTIRIEVLGQTFETALPARAVVVGRGEGVDLSLDCDGVAAVHCTLDVLSDGRHRVKDGGSGRETRVNGVAVKQVSLKPGDVIEVGDARITFLGGPAAVADVPVAAVPRAVPAKPASVAATPKPVPAKPKPVPAKPKTAPAQPKAVADESSSRSEPGPGHEARAPARARSSKPKSKLVMPLVVVALLGVLAVGLANFVDSDKAANEGVASRQFEQGRKRLDAKDFAGAREVFTALADDTTAGDYARKARVRLDYIRKTEAQLEIDLADLKARGLNLTAGALVANRESFVADYGEANAHRYDALKNAILQDHAHWRGEAVEIQRMETQVLLDRRQFGAALEGWRSFGASAPPAVDLAAEVRAGTDVVQLAAGRAADKALADAKKLDQRSGPRQARRLLEEQARGLVGTKAEIRIRARIRDFEQAEQTAAAERARPTQPTPTQPTPTQATPGQPTPEAGPATPTEPAHETLAKAALEAAGADVQAYRFDEAVKRIDKALADLSSGTGAAGPWQDRLGQWKQDLALADAAFGRLVADIPANPKRYRGIKVGGRMKASFVDADRETIATLVRGGKSRMKWSRVPAELMADVIGRMSPEGDAAVDAAALLHLIGGAEQRDELAFQAGQSGAATAPLFALLARWRGEDVPDGGYVVYAERYVTPVRRDFLVLEAKITAALGKVHDDDAAERAQAYEALLAVGEPAEERFREALESRRLQLADQIATSKAFRSGKTKKKLFEVMKQRRRTALALINDAAAYPYPNPSKKNQKRVEQLVDLVREIWERPFDPITQWNKKLKDELLVVTEVDEVLAQLDPGYEPDLDIIRDRINEAINMPAFTPDGQSKGIREYSLKVLDFNNKLDCTATPQEKDNTLIVNEYRMMMGLRAVKINERLLRAARGHSKHMRQNKYFAHDVPSQFATDTNRTPGIRARNQGYGGGTGENIAMGMGTGRGAFQAWFGSSGHHRNMVRAGWTEMGCGRSGRYWTQLFGSAGGSSLSAPAKLPDPAAPFAPESEGPSTPARRGPGLPDARGGNGGGLFGDDE